MDALSLCWQAVTAPKIQLWLQRWYVFVWVTDTRVSKLGNKSITDHYTSFSFANEQLRSEILSGCQVLGNIQLSEADCMKVILITRMGRRTGTTDEKKNEMM